MATEVTTRLRDDIDGSVADRTVSFTWEGSHYEIDLNKKNVAELDALLAPYVAAGRRSGAKPVSIRGRKAVARPVKASVRKVASAASGSALDLAAVRNWAAANGHSVAARGRISATVLDAFRAQSNGSAPASAAKPAAKAPAKRVAKRVAAKPAAKAAGRKRATKAPSKRAGRSAAAAPVTSAVSA